MYMNVKTENKESRDARAKLLNFYDLLIIHSEFSIVNKENFMKIKRRYRNDKKKRKVRNDDVFKNKFCFLDSISQKKNFPKNKSSNKTIQKFSSQSNTFHTDAKNQNATNERNDENWWIDVLMISHDFHFSDCIWFWFKDISDCIWLWFRDISDCIWLWFRDISDCIWLWFTNISDCIRAELIDIANFLFSLS